MADPAWLDPFKRQHVDQDKLDQIRAYGAGKIERAIWYRRISTLLCSLALAYVAYFVFEALTVGDQSAAMAKMFGKWADFLAAASAFIAVFAAALSPAPPNLAEGIRPILGKVVVVTDVLDLQKAVKRPLSQATDRAKYIAAAITFFLTVVKIPLG